MKYFWAIHESKTHNRNSFVMKPYLYKNLLWYVIVFLSSVHTCIFWSRMLKRWKNVYRHCSIHALYKQPAHAYKTRFWLIRPNHDTSICNKNLSCLWPKYNKSLFLIGSPLHCTDIKNNTKTGTNINTVTINKRVINPAVLWCISISLITSFYELSCPFRRLLGNSSENLLTFVRSPDL